MASKGKLTLFRDYCKGCGLCTAFCPRGILILDKDINMLGYHPVTVTDMDKCSGCALCARMCPDLVIQVERVS
ncbi:4Fe-4S binding protein [Calderihabitans maritimus]|uniref:4Fe-4S ferredoxin n=1 Tax=Calderihabitans maritimus TaxID=1246530 RepID=A0A1Z5HSR3_9FIRM|nr:4Fe-4S binding protein [Calderihabitans maritimus]GAW92355.1 4Fe-4S ferredoxin [Calderihabitans maritimus]